MHVHSFIPIAGLTLIPLVFATSIPPREIVKRANLSISDHLPTPWTYQGCYSDSTYSRSLSLDSYYDDNGMTEETCINYCSQRGYSLAGVEYARECYCGYRLEQYATKKNETECNMACTGNSQERCGDSARINVFSNGSPTPQTNPGVNSYTSSGCYSDSQTSRLLNTSMSTPGGPDSMSVSACTAACGKAGFLFAGVEYSKECFCGNALLNGGTRAIDSCNMACSGNKTEWCGGSGRINVYQYTGPQTLIFSEDFESGGSAWQSSPSSDGSQGLFASYPSNSYGAYTGNGYLYISTPSGNYGTSGYHGLCVSRTIFLPNNGSYVVTFNVGAIDTYYPDPRQPNPQYWVDWTVTLAGKGFGGRACEKGSCPLANRGGSKTYDSVASTIENVPQGYQTFQICARYYDTRRGQDDIFNFDNLQIFSRN